MYTVRKHTARMTGMLWFIVVDEYDSQVGPCYGDHDDAQIEADRLNKKCESCDNERGSDPDFCLRCLAAMKAQQST